MRWSSCCRINIWSGSWAISSGRRGAPHRRGSWSLRRRPGLICRTGWWCPGLISRTSWWCPGLIGRTGWRCPGLISRLSNRSCWSSSNWWRTRSWSLSSNWCRWSCWRSSNAWRISLGLWIRNKDWAGWWCSWLIGRSLRRRSGLIARLSNRCCWSTCY